MAEINPQEFADFTDHDGLCPHAKLNETTRELRGEPERISLRYIALTLFIYLVAILAALAWLAFPIKDVFEVAAILTIGILGILTRFWLTNRRLRARQGTWFVLDKPSGRLHLTADGVTVELGQIHRIVEFYGWYWGDRNQAERTCEISVLAQIGGETRRLRVVMIDPRRAPRLSKLLSATFHVPRTVITMPYFRAGPPRQVLVDKSC